MIQSYTSNPQTTLDLTNLTLGQSICFNQVAERIRPEYNDTIADLSAGYPEDLGWHLSSITSRYTNLSFTFLHCCQLSLVMEYLTPDPKITCVVTDSWGMSKVLTTYFENNQLEISVVLKRSLSIRFKMWLRTWKYLFLVVTNTFWQTLYAWVTKSQSLEDLREPIVLLDCFVLDNTFPPQEMAYQDRYYPGTLDYLVEKEKKQFFFLPTFVGVRWQNYLDIFRKIRHPANRFLLREDYLRFHDYLSAFAAMWQIRSLVRSLPSDRYRFQEFDLAPLLHEEIDQTWTNNTSFLGFLNYRFAQRLSEKQIPVRLVVDWSENQVTDKGLVKGFHDFYPLTSVIGYQGFIVDPIFHIYLHPTPYEIERGLIPDELCVIGEGLVERTKEFAPDLCVKSSPAFRFSELWTERPLSSASSKPYVLVALPIHLESVAGILSLLSQVLIDPELQHINFALKPHPTYPEDRVRKMFPGNWPKNLFFVSGDFNDCLDRASVLIGNYSSTCVEALARGIPAIIVGGQSGFTHNPIPTDIPSSIWKLCYAVSELTAAVRRFLARTPEEIAEHDRMGKWIRDRYFKKVDRQSVREFFRLPLDV
jgi:hypothetical protein